MAGLASKWQDTSGKEIGTFTIITTDANEIVGTIHNQMPVIFSPEQEIKWIDPSIDFQEVNQYLLPYPENNMTIYPISTLVNSPKNDSAEIVKPVSAK